MFTTTVMCLWSGCASTDKIIRRVNANGLSVDAARVRSTVCLSAIILFFPMFHRTTVKCSDDMSLTL